MTVDAGAQGPAGRPLAELTAEIAAAVRTLARDEVELAVIAGRQRAKQAGSGAALLAAAGLFAWFGAGCAVAAGLLALCLVVTPWFAGLIVAAAVLLVAGLTIAPGWRGITERNGPTPGLLGRNLRADVAAVRDAARQ
jgi:hypothetical protein